MKTFFKCIWGLLFLSSCSLYDNKEPNEIEISAAILELSVKNLRTSEIISDDTHHSLFAYEYTLDAQLGDTLLFSIYQIDTPPKEIYGTDIILYFIDKEIHITEIPFSMQYVIQQTTPDLYAISCEGEFFTDSGGIINIGTKLNNKNTTNLALYVNITK